VSNRQQCHFLFWRQFLVVENKQLGNVFCTEPLEPLEAKTDQSTLVRDNQV
jgi:hypothetical protein